MLISFKVLERTFHSYARQGVVRAYQIQSMLRILRPDLPIDNLEFENVLYRHDPENCGKFDLSTFNQIAVHYLVKASRQDNDDFSYKHLITAGDFPDAEEA